jgi:uncharacterized protein (DUF697 family)
MHEEGKNLVAAAKPSDLEAIGGVEGIKSGEWFLKLLTRSLRSYVENANAPYLRAKYPKMSDDAIADRLISLAARNAALVGGAAGLAMSVDEIATLASLGFALPGTIALAIGAVGADIIGVTHIQLSLIASLAGLYGEPLDPDDPEDILMVIKYFFAGVASDAAAGGAAHMGKAFAKTAVKSVFSGETLKAVQYYGRQVGMQILQRTIKNVALPIVSIALSAGANYFFTNTLGAKARADMKARAADIALHKSDAVPDKDPVEDAFTIVKPASEEPEAP